MGDGGKIHEIAIRIENIMRSLTNIVVAMNWMDTKQCITNPESDLHKIHVDKIENIWWWHENHSLNCLASLTEDQNLKESNENIVMWIEFIMYICLFIYVFPNILGKIFFFISKCFRKIFPLTKSMYVSFFLFLFFSQKIFIKRRWIDLYMSKYDIHSSIFWKRHFHFSLHINLQMCFLNGRSSCFPLYACLQKCFPNVAFIFIFNNGR